MITALLSILLAQLAGITGLKLWTRRSQQRAELGRWAPFRQNPVVDPFLRQYAGEPPTSPTKRWAANRAKSTIRNFVNSEAFNITIDGIINTDSGVWALKDKLPAAFRKTTKLGDLEPLEPSACTIH